MKNEILKYFIVRRLFSITVVTLQVFHREKKNDKLCFEINKIQRCLRRISQVLNQFRLPMMVCIMEKMLNNKIVFHIIQIKKMK